MRVLVDMDGPIADFDGAFFALCEEHGFIIDCKRDEQVHRFATNHMPSRAERRFSRALVDAPGWFASLPVTPGAKHGLKQLAKEADVWIATKPLRSSPTCCDEKREWLQANFGDEWVDRLIIAPDKSLIQADLLLDDAPYIEWLECAPWRAVMFASPFNGAGSGWAHLPRWTWDQPIDELLAHASIP